MLQITCKRGQCCAKSGVTARSEDLALKHRPVSSQPWKSWIYSPNPVLSLPISFLFGAAALILQELLTCSS